MWLQIKTPEVADGNNFGVEVQAFVAGELKVPAGPLDGPKGVGDGPHCQHLLCCPRLRPVHMNTCALVRRVSPPPITLTLPSGRLRVTEEESGQGTT